MPLYARLLAGEIELEPKAFRIIEIFDDKGNIRTEDERFESGTAQISIVGPMFKYGSWFWWGADEYAELIKYALQDKRIKGIILKIDSPGGEVGAINTLLQAIENRKKPVVALADSANSAAMWLASATDHIMANDPIGGSFGSIGVVCSFADYTKMYEDYGIKLHTIYAKESDDKNLDYRQALEGNYELFQENVLSPIATAFQEAVKAGRPKLKQNEPGILSGKSFPTPQALAIGLIDSIGNAADAQKRLATLADVVYPIMNNK